MVFLKLANALSEPLLLICLQFYIFYRCKFSFENEIIFRKHFEEASKYKNQNISNIVQYYYIFYYTIIFVRIFTDKMLRIFTDKMLPYDQTCA